MHLLSEMFRALKQLRWPQTKSPAQLPSLSQSPSPSPSGVYPCDLVLVPRAVNTPGPASTGTGSGSANWTGSRAAAVNSRWHSTAAPSSVREHTSPPRRHWSQSASLRRGK